MLSIWKSFFLRGKECKFNCSDYMCIYYIRQLVVVITYVSPTYGHSVVVTACISTTNGHSVVVTACISTTYVCMYYMRRDITEILLRTALNVIQSTTYNIQ